MVIFIALNIYNMYRQHVYIAHTHFYLSISILTQLIALQEITIAFPHIKLKPMHPSTDSSFP